MNLIKQSESEVYLDLMYRSSDSNYDTGYDITFSTLDWAKISFIKFNKYNDPTQNELIWRIGN